MPRSNKSLGLVDLIQRMKQDLLNVPPSSEPELFSIDEVTLEVNFTVSGDIESGFDFGVVTLGSNVSEERIQKVTIKMTPLVSKQQMIDKINQDSQKAQAIVVTSTQALTRGEEAPTKKGNEQRSGLRGD